MHKPRHEAEPASAHISANPYPWPHDGELLAANTALIIVDMQRDFCEDGGYISSMGYDISAARQIVPRISRILECFRQWRGLVVFTREGHRDDLSDLSELKLWRSRNAGIGIGAKGPLGRLLVRGEPGWDIIPDLAPQPLEPIVDKAGYSAFAGTDLEQILRTRCVRNIVIVGLTTDVCVHSTLRDAVDRGYECLVVEDACAATATANHTAAIATIATEGGIFGATASTGNLLCHFAESAGIQPANVSLLPIQCDETRV